MNRTETQRRFEALLECHELMLKECRRFAEECKCELQQFFKKCDHLHAHQQLWEHGDGYTLRGLPKDLSMLEDVAALVLVVHSFPLLGTRSKFDRFAPLTSIDYWVETKRLKDFVEVSGRQLELHFMVWQQDCSFHGESISHAALNRDLLWKCLPEFQELCARDVERSSRFLYACRDWLQSEGKPVIILTGRQPDNVDDRLQLLLSGSRYVKVSLRGRNYQIMDRLASELSHVR